MTELILHDAVTIEVLQRRGNSKKVVIEITCSEVGQALTLHDALTLESKRGRIHVTMDLEKRAKR